MASHKGTMPAWDTNRLSRAIWTATTKPLLSNSLGPVPRFLLGDRPAVALTSKRREEGPEPLRAWHAPVIPRHGRQETTRTTHSVPAQGWDAHDLAAGTARAAAAEGGLAPTCPSYASCPRRTGLIPSLAPNG